MPVCGLLQTRAIDFVQGIRRPATADLVANIDLGLAMGTSGHNRDEHFLTSQAAL